jgi:DNA-binding CsgD family transcriptional regulator
VNKHPLLIESETEKHTLQNVVVCIVDKHGRINWSSIDPLDNRGGVAPKIIDMAVPKDHDKILTALTRCLIESHTVEWETTGVGISGSVDCMNTPWLVRLFPLDRGDLAAVGICHIMAEYHAGITDDERLILRLLAADHMLKDIAEKMFLSENTIDTKMRHLKAKMGVRNIGGLVAKAINECII